MCFILEFNSAISNQSNQLRNLESVDVFMPTVPKREISVPPASTYINVISPLEVSGFYYVFSGHGQI